MSVTKEQFADYESVRRSGVTNMFDLSTVEDLSGLDKATICEIMKRYDDLMARWPEVRSASS